MAGKKDKNIRLSGHIVPTRYSISLAPNLEKFIFSGEEEILLSLTKPIKEITLHAAELEISEATFHHGSSSFKHQKIFYDEKLETATISFGETIKADKAKLKLKFSGILNDKMRGFYKSKYDINGKTHYMAVTQLESTDARRAIPSFDEPTHKAIFDVNLIIPKDLTAISNTVEKNVREHSPGYKIVSFEPTPKMSSYLLAFIVGHFEHVEAKTKEGVLVRVFTTPGKKHQAQFALETSVKCLEFYEDYFGIPYPLPSLDLIAIPDFAAGAMENWGAITYRETALLVDKEHSSTANKQWVALVIAHEIAHMWFGNLVTMEWWTYLWLNEGFASYIEYLAVDKMFPKWNIWTQFVYMDHAKALELDGLKNTHAIEVEVHHPSEISEIFDAVSYSKGASIIRMLAGYLGPKDFQKGLREYLKKHSYKNTKTSDLWESFERASGKKVKKVMENWTGKPGYPLVSVSQSKNSLKLTQERFFSSSISSKNSEDKTLWSIPINIVSGNYKKISSYLMSGKSLLVDKPSTFIKINSHETSFIRVNYTPQYLRLLHDPIKDKTLVPEDRFGIIRDAFVLAQSGQRSTADSLELVLSFEFEDSYIVWAQIASSLREINNLIYGTPFYESYKSFSRKIFGPISKKMGWTKKPNESHFETLLRSIVLYGLGSNGDKNTIEKARNLFEKLFSGRLKIDPDLRGVIYNLVAENGKNTEYEKLNKLYKKAPLQEEKDRIFRALCSFKDKSLLEKTLNLAFSKDMRAQDRFRAISFVWSNPVGRDLVWNFVQKNWKIIHRDFSGGHLFPRFIQPAVNFVDIKKAKEIEDFFKKNPERGLERTIAQVTEQIRSNALWLSRDKKNLSIFLQKYK